MTLCATCKQRGFDVEISWWNRGDGSAPVEMEANGFHKHRDAPPDHPQYTGPAQQTYTQTATKRKLKICPTCNNPTVLVRWEDAGFYPTGHARAGQKRWRLVNPDGSQHFHDKPWQGQQNKIDNSPAQANQTEAQMEYQKIQDTIMGAIKKQLTSISFDINKTLLEVERTRKEQVLIAQDVALIRRSITPNPIDTKINKEAELEPTAQEIEEDMQEAAVTDEQFGEDEIIPHSGDDGFDPENNL